MVAQVRRFNRTVTQRVGALGDRFLARDRSLGEARLLWEIGSEVDSAGGSDGQDVRSLRARLGLDSGYLSRLLRSLEEAGLVTVAPKTSDRRVRMAGLTPAGRSERAILDRRADELAGSLLEHLSPAQRVRLVQAMGEVERLLTATMVTVAPHDPAKAPARHCLNEYFRELDRRFDAGFDPEASLVVRAEELRPPAGVLLVAMLGSVAIGCGGLRLHGDEQGDQPAEIKRMWVAESARGLGVGRRLLTELETYAADHGAGQVRLETNRTLVEAIALYRSAGYVEVTPFNDEPYAHHWFAKDLNRGA